MFIEIKQQMRFAVFFIINGLWPLIMPALPCAGLVPVIYRRELIRVRLFNVGYASRTRQHVNIHRPPIIWYPHPSLLPKGEGDIEGGSEYLRQHDFTVLCLQCYAMHTLPRCFYQMWQCRSNLSCSLCHGYVGMAGNTAAAIDPVQWNPTRYR